MLKAWTAEKFEFVFFSTLTVTLCATVEKIADVHNLRSILGEGYSFSVLEVLYLLLNYNAGVCVNALIQFICAIHLQGLLHTCAH